MTPYDFSDAVPGLLLTREKGGVGYTTNFRIWPSPHGKWMVNDLPAMLVASVIFYSKTVYVSGEISRFGLQ